MTLLVQLGIIIIAIALLPMAMNVMFGFTIAVAQLVKYLALTAFALGAMYVACLGFIHHPLLTLALIASMVVYGALFAYREKHKTAFLRAEAVTRQLASIGVALTFAIALTLSLASGTVRVATDQPYIAGAIAVSIAIAGYLMVRLRASFTAPLPSLDASHHATPGVIPAITIE